VIKHLRPVTEGVSWVGRWASRASGDSAVVVEIVPSADPSAVRVQVIDKVAGLELAWLDSPVSPTQIYVYGGDFWFDDPNDASPIDVVAPTVPTAAVGATISLQRFIALDANHKVVRNQLRYLRTDNMGRTVVDVMLLEANLIK
jgi:hypothetical protein